MKSTSTVFTIITILDFYKRENNIFLIDIIPKLWSIMVNLVVVRFNIYDKLLDSISGNNIP